MLSINSTDKHSGSDYDDVTLENYMFEKYVYERANIIHANSLQLQIRLEERIRVFLVLFNFYFFFFLLFGKT